MAKKTGYSYPFKKHSLISSRMEEKCYTSVVAFLGLSISCVKVLSTCYWLKKNAASINWADPYVNPYSATEIRLAKGTVFISLLRVKLKGKKTNLGGFCFSFHVLYRKELQSLSLAWNKVDLAECGYVLSIVSSSTCKRRKATGAEGVGNGFLLCSCWGQLLLCTYDLSASGFSMCKTQV